MSRFVQTAYGPMPGCPDCGVVVLAGPHVCEHGVTPEQMIAAEFTASLSREDYDALTGSEQAR